MAIVNYDPNSQLQPQNTTNVLQNTGGDNTQNYVSNGNPYGQHSSTENVITSEPSGGSSGQPSARKQHTGASSGSFTNVQSYVDKNQGSSQQLSNAASKTLTNTSDIAKQNLNKAQESFTGQVGTGSLQNKDTALNEANTAYNEAANQQATTQKYNNANQAYLYQPNSTITGTGKDGSPAQFGGVDSTYKLGNTSNKEDDNYLIGNNLARVIYGDGTQKDFATQAEANKAIEDYNRQNPGYYSYGNEKELSTSDQRLADILNAQYKGPTDLSEAVGYDKAYNTIQDAAALQNQALNSGNQTELLKRAFSTGQNEYSTGNQLLDNLLLGQGSANEAFKATAQGLGTSETGLLTDDLKQAQRSANEQARNEASEVKGIRDQARQDLSDTANQRQQEVDSRINEVTANWEKYPEYFRNLFGNAITDYQSGKEGKAEYDKISGAYNNAKSQIDPILQKYENLGEHSPVLNNVKSSQGILNQVAELNKIISDPASYANRDSNGSYRSSLLNARAKLDQLMSNGSYANAQNVMNQANSIAQGYGTSLSELVNANDIYAVNKPVMDKYQADYDKYSKYSNYDPSKFDMNLSALEAGALGIQGGEGLYNLLQDSINGTTGTNTIENLFKTAQADRNQLVSRDEQSQLNRLQQLSQLANDYGSVNSGINYNNNYTNADLAGQQNATSALDMENFKNLVQGAEKGFRDDAKSSNITGYGYGTGSSGGAFGTKRASASKTLSQNFDDLIQQAGGYRNMYSDEGTNNDLLRQVISGSQGKLGSNINWEDSDMGDQLIDVSNMLGSAINPNNNTAVNVAMLTNPITAPLALGNMAGEWIGGSSSEAKHRAEYAAGQNALANLKANINNKVQSTGLQNQFNVAQNEQRDLELLRLLGVLDTTNL